MGRTGTGRLTMLPVEEPPMTTYVRPSLSSSTTATRRLPRINTAPQPLRPMDNRRLDLQVRTDIPLNPTARSIAKGLRHPDRREDTGVVGHHRSREDILELDTALVGSNTRPGRMGSLRPGRVGGVAIRLGIEPHHPGGISER